MKNTSQPSFTIFLSLGFLTALILGMLDYETETIWQLFNLENLPAMIIFSIIFGLFYKLLHLIWTFMAKKFSKTT